MLDYLVQGYKNKLAGSKVVKEIAPLITESNQFQMLHLYALFGLNEKKKKLTEFIQAGITHKNIFNYLLWIADYIKAGLQDAYLEETKYWYWVIVYILFRKYSKGIVNYEISSLSDLDRRKVLKNQCKWLHIRVIRIVLLKVSRICEPWAFPKR